MAVRLKTKWHSSKRRRSKGVRTLEDRATVVGVSIWKIAFNTFKHMETEGFRFGSDEQVTAVVNELIAFLLQVSDRLVYGQLSESERAEFITAVGRHLAATVDSNVRDFLGEGDHGGRFIATINSRTGDYAEFEFKDGGPGYAFVRYLGEKVSEAMAETDNKWVIEHVMEIEVPEAIKLLKRTLGEALGIAVG